MTSVPAAGPAHYATIGRRIGGYFIDSLLALFALVAGNVLAFGLLFVYDLAGALMGLAAYLLPLVYWIYACARMGSQGATPGQAVVKIRVVDADTGATIGFGRALLRWLVLAVLGGLCFGVLYVVIAIVASSNPRRQGWHDLAARTVVLEAADAPVAEQPVAPAPPTEGVMAVELPTSTGTPLPSPPGPPASPPVVSPTSAVPAPVAPAAVTPTPSAPATAPRPEGSSLVGPPPGVDGPVLPPPPADPTGGPAARELLPVPGEVDESTQLASRRRPPSWALTAPQGAAQTVRGVVVVGRNPDVSTEPAATAWSVDDATVSKTHAAFGIEGDQPWVEDRSSTNGSVVQRDGAEVELVPGERFVLRGGDVVLLGDLEITVGRRS